MKVLLQQGYGICSHLELQSHSALVKSGPKARGAKPSEQLQYILLHRTASRGTGIKHIMATGI